jgi:hypothetical protein
MPRSSDYASDAASYGRQRLPDKKLDELCYGRIIYAHLRKHGRPVKEPHYGIILSTDDQIKKIRLRQNPIYDVICISNWPHLEFLLDPPAWTRLTGKIQGEWQTDVEEAAILKIGPRLHVAEMIKIQEFIRDVAEKKKPKKSTPSYDATEVFDVRPGMVHVSTFRFSGSKTVLPA